MIPLLAGRIWQAATVAAGALALVLAITAGVQTWKLRGERASHAETRVTLSETARARDQAIATNQALTRRVEAQNQEIAKLRTDGERREKAAGAAIRRILEKPPPIPEGAGPDVLNAFIRSTMGVIAE